MALFVTSLNSGSNGNCYYIGNETDAVLIDAGISCRETEKRLKRLCLAIDKVRGVFISHEHGDHIYGLPTLLKKYRIPVYITSETAKSGRLNLDEAVVNFFQPHLPVQIGGLTITPFPKFHDASDPHSFIVSYGKLNAGVFTDIGKCCENVSGYFKKCHAAFLESNYDEQMLMNGGYPYHLKKRISGGNGHLSNIQALQLFLLNRPPFMTHLLLSHLSKNNNRPELVYELFKQHAGNTEIIVASRDEETPVFRIEGDRQIAAKPTFKTSDLQLALF